MKKYPLFLIVFISFSFHGLFASPDKVGVAGSVFISQPERGIPIPGISFLIDSEQKNRFVAAALAITLGMVGAHRIYLGTKPLVPVIYIITLGGGLGLLPLIDTIMILSTKDLAEFENNPKVFMWMK